MERGGHAGVAKLADARDLGSRGRKAVLVQVQSPAFRGVRHPCSSAAGTAVTQRIVNSVQFGGKDGTTSHTAPDGL